MDTSSPPAAQPLRSETAAQMEAVKQALRREIRRRGWRQRDLARQLGYSDSYLANLLGNIKGREPAGLRVDTLLALLQLLKLDPLEFLGAILMLPAAPQGRVPRRSQAAILELAALFERAEGVPEPKVEELTRAAMTMVGVMMSLLVETESSGAPQVR